MVRERQAEADQLVRRSAPLLAEALPLIGHPAIRSRGTIGGSLSHADPAAELPAVAVALSAELVVASSARGRRSLNAEDFFTGFFTTAMDPDEILVQVRFPGLPAGTGTAIAEVARRHGDFAMVGAASLVRIENGRIVEARVVLTGVSGTPLLLTDAQKLLGGAEPTTDLLREAAVELAKGLSPPSDIHGSSAYRRHVAAGLIGRTLQTSVRRAEEVAA
jgi:carbon-monoxide dehydrogenase medium subunit